SYMLAASFGNFCNLVIFASAWYTAAPFWPSSSHTSYALFHAHLVLKAPLLATLVCLIRRPLVRLVQLRELLRRLGRLRRRRLLWLVRSDCPGGWSGVTAT